MASFARLKDGVTVAIRICGKYLYPTVETWIKYEDFQYDILKADDRIEVLTQYDMDYLLSDTKVFIDELINFQWNSVKKKVSTMTDIELLKKAAIEAELIGKHKVSEVINERAMELEVKNGTSS